MFNPQICRLGFKTLHAWRGLLASPGGGGGEGGEDRRGKDGAGPTRVADAPAGAEQVSAQTLPGRRVFCSLAQPWPFLCACSLLCLLSFPAVPTFWPKIPACRGPASFLLACSLWPEAHRCHLGPLAFSTWVRALPSAVSCGKPGAPGSWCPEGREWECGRGELGGGPWHREPCLHSQGLVRRGGGQVCAHAVGCVPKTCCRGRS